MMRKLYLLVSIEQSHQLHSLISDLELQFTDSYLDSKGVKQNSIQACSETLKFS